MRFGLVFSSFVSLVLTLFFSLDSISQTKSIIVPEDKYFVDNQNKIILCTEKISNLGNIDDAADIIMQFDRNYKLKGSSRLLSYSRSYDLQVVEGDFEDFKLFFTQLPVFSISTESEIVDDPKVSAYLTYSDNTGIVLSSNIGIEYRGGWSQNFPKKSLDLEFWEDETGEKTIDVKFGNLRRDDDWILDALYNEPLRINSYTAHKLWLEIHTLYYAGKAPKAKAGADVSYVELFLNGQYQGIYMLSEQVDRKQLDLKKTDGITIEGELIKGIETSAASTFIRVYPFDNKSDIWDGLEMKYPDEFINWTNIYSFVDYVVYSPDEEFKNGIFNYFDIGNAIDYFIFMNVLGASDNTGKNIYICRYKSGEPYFYTPWDLDGTYGTMWDGTRHYLTTFELTNGLYDRLFRLNPNQFVEKLLSRWDELRASKLSYISLTEGLDKNYNVLKSNNIYERESMIWKDYRFSINDSTFMKSWIAARLEFFDEYLHRLGDANETSKMNSYADVAVYPTPVSDFLTIDFKGVDGTEYSMINLQGVVQKKGELYAGKNKLEISNFEDGIYLLVIGNTIQKISIVKKL